MRDSRIGKFGKEARRWKGMDAGYVAIHMWLTKHYQKSKCEYCGKLKEDVSRLEWANISGEYHREREDYLCLCPSCHRKIDLKKDACPQGHLLKNDNLYVNPRGHRQCKTCHKESQKKYMERNNAKTN